MLSNLSNLSKVLKILVDNIDMCIQFYVVLSSLDSTKAWNISSIYQINVRDSHGVWTAIKMAL